MMKDIEQLLEKYWEGETTLAEERQLKAFFLTNKDLPPHLAAVRGQFVFFAEAQKEVLDENFEQDFLLKLPEKPKKIKLVPQKSVPIWQWASGIAAGILLFGFGFFFGKNTFSSQNPAELSEMRKEMKDLRETVLLSQLKQSSASERLKGVNYVAEVKSESPEVQQALIETLNSDENPNVRLAAANALFTFKDVPKVREALVESIKHQDDPSVKIALINMMIVLKEKKAKPVIEEFLQKEPIPQEVKESIRKELRSI